MSFFNLAVDFSQHRLFFDGILIYYYSFAASYKWRNA